MRGRLRQKAPLTNTAFLFYKAMRLQQQVPAIHNRATFGGFEMGGMGAL